VSTPRGIRVYGRSWKLNGFCSAFLLCAALLSSGCSVSGNNLASITSGEKLVTNSVVEKAKPEGIQDTDADVIKSTVSTAKVETKITPLAWANPKTGSSGTIVAIDTFMGKHGQRCRGFKTSVDSFMGISFYNGEACQISANEWVLSWFKSADSTN